MSAARYRGENQWFFRRRADDAVLVGDRAKGEGSCSLGAAVAALHGHNKRWIESATSNGQ